MKRPNTFIIGAPKCGTTSLAAWLGEHPQVFMSTPKEPWFFCSERLEPEIRSLEDYEALFSQAEAKHRVIAEASTMYFVDEQAVPKLLDYAPQARLIVMLRNPTELAVSWHGQMVRVAQEPIAEFERAWSLVERRRIGVGPLCRCRDDIRWDYDRLATLGTQLERLFTLVPRHRVHVIVLDDLRQSRKRVWSGLLDFLGLDDDGRAVFPVHNAGYLPRFPRLYSVLIRSTAAVKAAVGFRGRTGLVASLAQAMSREYSGRDVSPQTRRTLANHFTPEVKKLERLLGRDLSHWRE